MRCYRETQELAMNEQKLADARNALIACLLANSNRDAEKHPEPYELTDFCLLQHDDVEETRQSDEDEAEDGEGKGQWGIIKSYFMMCATRDSKNPKEEPKTRT